MAMSDQEINELINRIQSELDEPSAEMRNALHACRPGHPLGRDRQRAEVFRSAAFMITGAAVVGVMPIP